jgi:hypothetical protein
MRTPPPDPPYQLTSQKQRVLHLTIGLTQKDDFGNAEFLSRRLGLYLTLCSNSLWRCTGIIGAFIS